MATMLVSRGIELKRIIISSSFLGNPISHAAGNIRKIYLTTACTTFHLDKET